MDAEKPENSTMGGSKFLAAKGDGMQVGVIQTGDSVSKAGSTISKPVAVSN